jgi:hypothetical protein
MKKFAYELAPFPSCCQASIVHGMYEEGFVKNDLDKGSFIGRLTDYGSYMKFAITADHQGNAICDTLGRLDSSRSIPIALTRVVC